VLRPRSLSNALDSSQQQSLQFFQGKTVHALAGIGFPDRFFDLLRKSGLKLLTHAFPDHYQFQKKDIEFKDELPILLTEKDAVKCAGFMSSKHWILSVEAVVNPLFDMRLLRMLEELK
jgi:tetraacyldisaccharide 4'-kinase